jgi:hypothetical protein
MVQQRKEQGGMNREQMLRELVEFSLAAATEDPQSEWLRNIFTKGFRGFASMSSGELLRELHYRDLAGSENAVGDQDFEEEDEEEDAPGIENLIGLDRSRSAEDAGRD